MVEGLMGTPSFFKKARNVLKFSSLLFEGSSVIRTRGFELLLGGDDITGLHAKDCDLIGRGGTRQCLGSILD